MRQAAGAAGGRAERALPLLLVLVIMTSSSLSIFDVLPLGSFGLRASVFGFRVSGRYCCSNDDLMDPGTRLLGLPVAEQNTLYHYFFSMLQHSIAVT